jgi:hypothetical protein
VQGLGNEAVSAEQSLAFGGLVRAFSSTYAAHWFLFEQEFCAVYGTV